MKISKKIIGTVVASALTVSAIAGNFAMAADGTAHGVTTATTITDNVKTVTMTSTSKANTSGGSWFYIGAVDVNNKLMSVTVDIGTGSGGSNVAATATQQAWVDEDAGTISSNAYNGIFKGSGQVLKYQDTDEARSVNATDTVKNLSTDSTVYLYAWINNANTTVTVTSTSTTEASPTYAAKIGDTTYATLDEAAAAAIDKEAVIELYKDQTLTKNNIYAITNGTIRIQSADNEKKTITLAPEAENAEIFTWNKVVFENINICMAENESIKSIYSYNSRGNIREFMLNNSTITGIVVTDCISVAKKNDLTNATVTGNTAAFALFANREDSTISGSTITGNNENSSVSGTHLGAVQVAEGTTTIANSAIKNNTFKKGDVEVDEGAAVVLSGSTEIGNLYDNGGTIKLAADFTGSAKITNIATTTGTAVIDAVEEGATVSGITVDGLAENQELKLENGALIIAEKTVPSSLTATVANIGATYGKNEDGSADESTQATGFVTTITGTGSFNAVSWAVTSKGTTKNSFNTGNMTAITLNGGSCYIGMVINGLYDNNATATAEAKLVQEVE